jgi:hypothetical protein
MNDDRRKRYNEIRTKFRKQVGRRYKQYTPNLPRGGFVGTKTKDSIHSDHIDIDAFNLSQKEWKQIEKHYWETIVNNVMEKGYARCRNIGVFYLRPFRKKDTPYMRDIWEQHRGNQEFQPYYYKLMFKASDTIRKYIGQHSKDIYEDELLVGDIPYIDPDFVPLSMAEQFMNGDIDMEVVIQYVKRQQDMSGRKCIRIQVDKTIEDLEELNKENT